MGLLRVAAVMAVRGAARRRRRHMAEFSRALRQDRLRWEREESERKYSIWPPEAVDDH